MPCISRCSWSAACSISSATVSVSSQAGVAIFFFFQAEDGIRDIGVTGVQTCALTIYKFHPKSNVEKMSAGHPLTDEDRWPWLQAIADEIDRVCRLGGNVVVACSALKRAYRDVLVHGRADVRIVYLDGTHDLIA